VSGDDVPKDRWRQQCTCPGAAEWRAHLDESEANRAERNEKARLAVANVRPRPGASRAEIVGQLEESFRDQGIDPAPGELELSSRLMEAKTSPPLKASLQALGAIGHWISDLVRIARSDNQQSEHSPYEGGAPK